MANLIRVRTVLSGWPGGPGLNTFYFSTASGTVGNTEAADVCARVRSYWDSIKGLFPTSFRADVNGAPDTLDIASGVLTGTLNGGSPPQVAGTTGTAYNMYAGMILLKGATTAVVNGRREQGRSFIGPVTSGADVGGVPDAAYRTAVSNGANVLLLTGSTTAFPGVWHRPVNGAGGSFNGVSVFTTAPYFAVLRSRRD